METRTTLIRYFINDIDPKPTLIYLNFGALLLNG